MKITVFAGDIADAPAEAICTSTNPGLTLVMGTGAAVRDRGGFEILRACEKLVANGPLPLGSAHVTTAGKLDAKIVIHCVASDSTHHSSPDIVRACTKSALARAEEQSCRSIALPLFGSGHARLRLEASARTIAEVLRDVRTSVARIYVVAQESDDAEIVQRIVGEIIPGSAPALEVSDRAEAELPGGWMNDW
jgi:O-acetyl-ADP-ribose deacetylase